MAAPSPTRRFPIARAVWIMLAVALAIILAVVLAAALIDWNQARGWVGKQAAERTGRELVIGGDLRVHPLSLHPHVHAEQVRFANAPWRDPRPMLEADSVDFRVSLMHLLAGNLVF